MYEDRVLIRPRSDVIRRGMHSLCNAHRARSRTVLRTGALVDWEVGQLAPLGIHAASLQPARRSDVAFASMGDERVDEQWLTAKLTGVDESDGSDDVLRLKSKLVDWAHAFAAKRADVESGRLAEPRRGLRDDEARAFLRAVDHGFAVVDDGGYVTLPWVRGKRPAGRYALLSKSGAGVSINLEYVVQVGATAELVLDHGWDGREVDFERGEFDALAYAPSGRPLLVMEAKARARGPDSL
jgi:hypothetical protein